MNVQVENLEKNMAKLTVEVPAEEVEKALQAAYMKEKGKISIPGFRKGKVPRQMIEKMYGAAVFYEEAANILIQDNYAAAMDESKLDIVSRPVIDVVQIEAGKSFIFTAEVAVRPEVELGQYMGVEIEKINTEVTEEDIEAEIKRLQNQQAREITVERAAELGDTVVIDYVGSVDGVEFEGGKGENYPLELGSGSFIPGFEDQLVGAAAGADVDVNVTFPEEYHADDLAGKAALFQVKVHEVKTKELPEADDEFAQDISDFDTLAEFKEDLAKRLAAGKEEDAKAERQQKVMDIVVANAQMDIPDAMVQKNVDDMMNQWAQQLQSQGIPMDVYFQYTGATPAQVAEQFRPQALANIKNRLVLDAIVAAENITVTDEDIDAEVKRMADMWKMDFDKVKELIAEDVIKDYAAQKALEIITAAAVEK